MNIDITKLNLNLEQFLEINEKIIFSKNDIVKTEMVDLKEVSVKGLISKTSDTTLNLNLNIKGVMILQCAISLENISYPFDILLDKNLSTDDNSEEYIKINENTLDISPIVWENIVMEIPMKVVNENYKAITNGDGWSLNNQGDGKIDPRLECLKDLLEEEK